MAKIKFKKNMYLGNGVYKMVEDEGTAYETKNGIKVALSQDKDGKWIATELTTGKIAVPRPCRTRSELKSNLEEIAPTLEKLLKKIPDTKKQPIKDVRNKEQIKMKKVKNSDNTKRTKAKKPAVKKIEAKKPTSKTTPKQTKKTDPKVKYPKHNPKEELEIGKERPIIINGKANKAPKQPQAAQPSKASVTSRAGRVSSITYHIRYD